MCFSCAPQQTHHQHGDPDPGRQDPEIRCFWWSCTRVRAWFMRYAPHMSAGRRVRDSLLTPWGPYAQQMPKPLTLTTTRTIQTHLKPGSVAPVAGDMTRQDYWARTATPVGWLGSNKVRAFAATLNVVIHFVQKAFLCEESGKHEERSQPEVPVHVFAPADLLARSWMRR